MNENLFVNLFKYRPRPGRNPLEDFTTECMAYLLSSDKILFERFIMLLTNRFECRIQNYKIKTQFVADSSRIDMAIFWTEDGNSHSLFVEHKIESSPWEVQTKDGNIKNQIDHYCDYQERSHKNKHYVALISKYSDPKYSRENSPRRSYLGNITWKQVAILIKDHLKDREQSGIISTFGPQFIEFMRRYDMAGFEKFSMAELASIPFYKSFEKNLSLLTTAVTEYFNKREDFFKGKNLKRYNAWGTANISEHYGALFHNTDYAPDAWLWIFFGLATANPPDNEPWFLKLSNHQDMIPDVECAVYMWFDDTQQMRDFMNKVGLEIEKWEREEKDQFALISSLEKNFVAIIKRESLVAFLKEEDQEGRILSFLGDGYESIIKKGGIIEKTISEFVKSCC